jgi:hypothetical protein
MPIAAAVTVPAAALHHRRGRRLVREGAVAKLDRIDEWDEAITVGR